MGGTKRILEEQDEEARMMALAREAQEADEYAFEEEERAKAEAAEAKIRVESIVYEMDTIVSNPVSFQEKINLDVLEAKLRKQNTETLIQFGRHYYERSKWLEEIAHKFEMKNRRGL